MATAKEILEHGVDAVGRCRQDVSCEPANQIVNAFRRELHGAVRPKAAVFRMRVRLRDEAKRLRIASMELQGVLEAVGG